MKVFTQTGLTKLIQLIKANFISNSDVSTINIDTIPTANSTNLITSGGVYTLATSYCPNDDSRLSDARTPTSHNQAASTVTAGTLGGKVLANASSVTTLSDKQVRNIYAGTSDMTAGTTALTTGDIYVVYEA